VLHRRCPAPFEAGIAEAGAGDRGGDRLEEVIEVLQRRSIGMLRLMSTIGHRYRPGGPHPIPLSAALVAYFEATDLPLRAGPVEAAHLLRSLAFARSHPLLTDRPDSPAAIARLFLHGVGERS
jgi:hypothetical protein